MSESSFVWVDSENRPWLIAQGWLHYRSEEQTWVRLRRLRPNEAAAKWRRRLPAEKAMMMGVPMVFPSRAQAEAWADEHLKPKL